MWNLFLRVTRPWEHFLGGQLIVCMVQLYCIKKNEHTGLKPGIKKRAKKIKTTFSCVNTRVGCVITPLDVTGVWISLLKWLSANTTKRVILTQTHTFCLLAVTDTSVKEFWLYNIFLYSCINYVQVLLSKKYCHGARPVHFSTLEHMYTFGKGVRLWM